ncbi:hypothetical protein JAAARDRAFT_82449, partial [Jaapia argillacea MUCL 33604]
QIDTRTTLGKTTLPRTLTSLLNTSSGTSSQPRTSAIFEILRVGANLCVDHDENRSLLLDAGFPQAVLSLLESYADLISPTRPYSEPLPLSLLDLKVVRTAIGVLLNASIGHDAVKSRLISLEAAVTVLRLSSAIYPSGSWLTAQPEADASEAAVIESWNLRSSLSNWSWRVIGELKDDRESEVILPQCWTFSSDLIPVIVCPLLSFIPPYASPSGIFSGPDVSALRRTLLQADFAALEESCSLIESMTLDVSDIRLSLARRIPNPSDPQGADCLSNILTFIEHAAFPPLWSSDISAEENRARERTFGFCKAALIKGVVEIAGEEKNEDVLWEEGGGEFIQRMVGWINKYKDLSGSNIRDDLIICATLSLGNLVRQDVHSSAIIRPPIALAPTLAELLQPEADIKVKHGIVGLLKNIAQFPANRGPLGESGIIRRLIASDLYAEKSDIAETVEVSAIGVAKHLCNGNVDNCIALVELSDDERNPSSGLDRIIALVQRTDAVTIKSEGTRVLVNVIKTLWSSDGSAGGDEQRAKKRREAMQAVVNPSSAAALAQLAGRSRKYPLLVNEAVVALSLISMHASGGKVVLDAIMNTLPREAAAPTPKSSIPSISSPGSVSSPAVRHPARALDMLVTVLKNLDTRYPFPPEVRANVCALLGQLGRKGVVKDEDNRAPDLQQVKDATRSALEAAASIADQEVLSNAAKKALETWGTA